VPDVALVERDDGVAVDAHSASPSAVVLGGLWLGLVETSAVRVACSMLARLAGWVLRERGGGGSLGVPLGRKTVTVVPSPDRLSMRK
jgi:hypothetical protein